MGAGGGGPLLPNPPGEPLPLLNILTRRDSVLGPSFCTPRMVSVSGFPGVSLLNILGSRVVGGGVVTFSFGEWAGEVETGPPSALALSSQGSGVGIVERVVVKQTPFPKKYHSALY